MAIIHRTTMVPGKRDLLTAWLPAQPWYAGHPSGPSLARAGGFRLDDPAGEVGIEFDVARDDAAGGATAYLVPMTYRGSPLAGADAALIGTAEHGVLGKRWIYDGTQDPVLLAALTELFLGRAQPQAQSQSNTADETVQVTPLRAGRLEIAFERVLTPAREDRVPGQVTALWTAPDGTGVRSVLATAAPLLS